MSSFIKIYCIIFYGCFVMNDAEEKKILTKYVLTSLFALLMMSLIAFIAILMIALSRPVASPNTDTNKKSYKFDLTTNVLDSTSGLDANDNFVYVSPKEDVYYISVTFASNENAGIGSYVDKDYLFHSYGGTINELTITFEIFDKETEQPFNNYSDLSISISQGNKANNYPLYNYQLNDNVITYSSSEEIYVYSLSVGFMAWYKVY